MLLHHQRDATLSTHGLRMSCAQLVSRPMRCGRGLPSPASSLARWRSSSTASLVPSDQSPKSSFSETELSPPSDARILGRAYVKQVDVLVAQWARGAELLVSTKTMVSSFRNNLANRFEESYGDAKNLRGRYPLVSMGFLFLLHSTILNDKGAFEKAVDMLRKFRAESDVYDATCLLLAEWDDTELDRVTIRSDSVPDDLRADCFLAGLISTVLDRTPSKCMWMCANAENIVTFHWKSPTLESCGQHSPTHQRTDPSPRISNGCESSTRDVLLVTRSTSGDPETARKLVTMSERLDLSRRRVQPSKRSERVDHSMSGVSHITSVET
jgi:hypothetical protein